MILSDRDGGLGILFNCASSDAIGSPVRISGINTVTTADATDPDRSLVIGFIITKPTPTTCYITDSLYYSAASGFSGFSGIAGSSTGFGQPVYLTNSSGFSGIPGTTNKILGESISPREAILRADPVAAITYNNSVSFKNKFINGAFDVWQYGTSSVSIGSSGKPDRVDRFVAFNNTGATLTHAQGVPSLLTYELTGIKVNYCSSLGVSVADTSLTGDERFNFYQVIEGFYAKSLAYSGFTFSFWMYGTQGVYSAFAGDGTYYYVQHFVLPHNTWTRIKLYFPPNANFAGSTTNGTGLSIGITLALSASSTFATSILNVWQAAIKVGSTTQTNGVSSNTNAFFTTLWQVEEGSVATKFEERPYGTELLLCQRYAYVLTNPTAGERVTLGTGVCDSTTTALIHRQFPVQMRTDPTLINFTSQDWDIYDGFAVYQLVAAGLVLTSSVSLDNCLIQANCTGLTQGRTAMLFGDTTAARQITFTAEF